MFEMQIEAEKTSMTSKETTRDKRIANLKPSVKGQPSRNPSGRPKKDYDLAALAQTHAKKAIETLVEVMSSAEAPPSARVSAAGEILDRGFGRAPQSIALNATIDFGAQFEDFIRGLSAGSTAKVIEGTSE